MKNKNRTDNEVEKTLQSLNGMKQAKTDDFFYSRLQARMESKNADQNSVSNFTFAFSMAAMILLIVLNVISLIIYPKIWNDESLQQDEFTTDLTANYQLYDLSYYENLEEE